MRIKCFYLLAFIFVGLLGNAQSKAVSGYVFDAETLAPLAFVNIVSNAGNIGSSTDIDGRFQIISNEDILLLHLSYVGYEQKTFQVDDSDKTIKIYLHKTSLELEEVVIVAGKNPAHRIISHVIENRKLNNPENLPSFSYTSYDKMIFTVDSLGVSQGEINPRDSGYIRLKNFLEDKDFFMMETVSERKFMAPDRNHEKVLASRISGFKDPVLLFLSSQLQSSTFYNEFIKISNKSYVNPISPGSLKKYYFNIEDTTLTARGDTVFVISFRPRIKTNFNGLQGVLSINTYKWAIQNVKAEPARDEKSMSVKIQQMYALINDTTWFPVQLNTDVIFNTVSVNNFVPVGRGKSYNRDILLNPDLVKRQFNQISVELAPNAGDRSEAFWLKYRGDSLSSREQRTYAYVDSIGREANLDGKAYVIKSLLNNRMPLGFIDLDLSKFVRINDYEGVYLGLGVLTSKKLSQTFELGAHWGYGFRDQTSKYGGKFTLIIERYREVKLKLLYFNDLTETGGVRFYGQKDDLLNPENFRNLMINRMDHTKRVHASVSFRALRYGTFYMGLTKDVKRVTSDYYFDPGNGDLQLGDPEYLFTDFTVGMRYAFKEKFLEMPDARLSLGTKYPIIWFNYTRGLDGVLDGEFVYNKYDFKLEKTFVLKYLGTTKIELLSGYVDRPIPQANLYNGRGSYRVFTIYAPTSFATQRMNEFLSDTYAYLFFTHNFGQLLWRGEKFSPEFALATNLGLGSLKHPEYHKGVIFKEMDHVFVESGLLINSIVGMAGVLKFGLGAFYRYGYYHLPKLPDNFAYKISITFPF